MTSDAETLPDPKNSRKRKAVRDAWTDQQTETLISIFGKVYLAKNRSNLRPKDWTQVQTAFDEWCFQTNNELKLPKQVQNKADNMKKKYRAEKDAEESSGGTPSTWKWFSFFNDVFGEDPKLARKACEEAGINAMKACEEAARKADEVAAVNARKACEGAGVKVKHPSSKKKSGANRDMSDFRSCMKELGRMFASVIEKQIEANTELQHKQIELQHKQIEVSKKQIEANKELQLEVVKLIAILVDSNNHGGHSSSR